MYDGAINTIINIVVDDILVASAYDILWYRMLKPCL